jgi:predicted flap endonuclease-1-like 5' DNA nuclease
MEDLTQLPNIGEVLSKKLREIGVESHSGLAAMGSVAAVMKIGDVDRAACYNMLYALEGAIRRVRWHAIARDERSKIKEEFDLAMGE